MSSRAGCNPSGESSAAFVARDGCVVVPHRGMGDHVGDGHVVHLAVASEWRFVSSGEPPLAWCSPEA